MDALIADGLSRHPDIDVKASVASCISEIVRITASYKPYDDIIEIFFELAVSAFGKLSFINDRAYTKSVQILKVLEGYRVCVLMLDLKLDTLVVQMFQHFLNNIRPDHPEHVFTYIEKIMSMIIAESKEISVEILDILISCVKKGNQNVSPCSHLLAEIVLQKGSVKLRPYLPRAVKSLSISINKYSSVVGLIWREAINSETSSASEYAEELVGWRVRVWWPLDATFYDGCITLFDSSTKQHTVDYDDGDQELLDLRQECWELIGDANTLDYRQATVPSQSISAHASRVPL